MKLLSGRPLMHLFKWSTNRVCSRITRRQFHEQYGVGILGVPLSRGQAQIGVEFGPSEIRAMGIDKQLRSVGLDVHDYGDVDVTVVQDDFPVAGTKYPRTVGKTVEKLSNQVHSIIKEDKRVPLIIGGDHSMGIGSIHGHMRAEENVCIIWVDAHADINTPLTSFSGNIHGMPLSFLMHETQEYMPKVPGFEWVKPCFSAKKDIAFIGLRDVDEPEAYMLDKFGMTAFSMQDIDRHGIDYVLKQALKAINPNMDRPIHLSFDIDSLTPAEAPSTGTPVSGGMTLREGLFLAEEIGQTGLLSAMDFVELNVHLARTRQERELTVKTAIDIITHCFGVKRCGNYTPDFQLPRPVIDT